MPLYEYQCTKCGHRFEHIQSYSAEDVKECPVCQGAVERLISAPAIRFKGHGFYSTDYGAQSQPSPRHDSDGASNKAAASDGATASVGNGSAKTESASSPAPAEKSSKPASKPDSKSAS